MGGGAWFFAPRGASDCLNRIIVGVIGGGRPRSSKQAWLSASSLGARVFFRKNTGRRGRRKSQPVALVTNDLSRGVGWCVVDEMGPLARGRDVVGGRRLRGGEGGGGGGETRGRGGGGVGVGERGGREGGVRRRGGGRKRRRGGERGGGGGGGGDSEKGRLGDEGGRNRTREGDRRVGGTAVPQRSTGRFAGYRE